jgi:hypothetical protein
MPKLVFSIQKSNSRQNSNSEHLFLNCGLFSCNILIETCYFDLIFVLLSFVSKVQETSLLVLEPGTVFPICNVCSCNLAERNNFCPGVILLSCLVSELKNSNPGQFFRGCGLWSPVAYMLTLLVVLRLFHLPLFLLLWRSSNSEMFCAHCIDVSCAIFFQALALALYTVH